VKIEELENYLQRLEKNREKDELNNERAYEQAREMSAWLSLAKYGAGETAKQAQRIIKSL
jgi:hypothetical protein